MQSLFPYQSYKPLAWDRYYLTDTAPPRPSTSHGEGESSTVSSGFAAGVTIAVFFVVFIFTFGCRIYSEYIDRGSSTSASRSTEPVITEQMAADFWICGVPRSPPPPYEVAILMPKTMPVITAETSS